MYFISPICGKCISNALCFPKRPYFLMIMTHILSTRQKKLEEDLSFPQSETCVSNAILFQRNAKICDVFISTEWKICQQCILFLFFGGLRG